MNDQKFEVGDKVRVLRGKYKGKETHITGISQYWIETQIPNPYGHFTVRVGQESKYLLLLKKFTALCDDEIICQKIAELMRPNSTLTSRVFEYPVCFIGIDDRFEVKINCNTGIMNLSYNSENDLLDIPFLELTKLLTEAGYYPTHES